jgi:hypothetical protein
MQFLNRFTHTAYRVALIGCLLLSLALAVAIAGQANAGLLSQESPVSPLVAESPIATPNAAAPVATTPLGGQASILLMGLVLVGIVVVVVIIAMRRR